jgi:hypothetical protein
MRILLCTALALVLSAPSGALARGHGGGNGFGHSMRMSNGRGVPQWSGSNPPGFSSRGRRTGWRGASVPPGWSKGRKKGWHGANLPPGLVGR